MDIGDVDDPPLTQRRPGHGGGGIHRYQLKGLTLGHAAVADRPHVPRSFLIEKIEDAMIRPGQPDQALDGVVENGIQIERGVGHGGDAVDHFEFIRPALQLLLHPLQLSDLAGFR